jgi:hypothetical protein
MNVPLDYYITKRGAVEGNGFCGVGVELLTLIQFEWILFLMHFIKFYKNHKLYCIYFIPSNPFPIHL